MADKTSKPMRFDEFKKWLIELETDEERLFVRRWISQHMNRWGQIPLAAARRASRNLRWWKSPDDD